MPEDLRTLAMYSIGNSLTADTLGPISNGISSFFVLARQADVVIDPLGYHIACGSNLRAIEDHPTDTCVDPVDDIGPLASAIPNPSWNVMTVQPYPGSESTFSSDVDVISHISNDVGPDTRVFIFTGWPPHDGYEDSWSAPITVGPDTPTTLSRAYFVRLMAELETEIDNDVILIPAGEVLYRLDQRLVSGAVPGMTDVSDLYRDDLHLNSLGQWVAGVTAASVILEVDPFTFGKPGDPWYGDGSEFSREFMDTARTVIAEVIG